MSTVTKLTPNGTFYITGTIDEATYNPNSGYYKNLYAYSQDFQTWLNLFGAPYACSYYAANSAIAPDGTMTAWTISNIPNQNSSFSNPWSGNIAFNFGSKYAPPNSVYTKSIYAKWVTGSPNLYFQLIPTVGPYAVTQFNLQTGVASGGSGYLSAGMVYAGNGWWRCWQTFNSGPSSYNGPGFIGDSFFVGGYGSTNLNTTMQFWGTQMELGNLSIYERTGAPSNIPTSGAGVPLPIVQFANRTDANGNYYISGTIDEATYNPNSGLIKNLVINSQTFNGSDWSKVNATISSTTEIAPDGTNTASFYKENYSTTFDAHQFYKGINPLTAGTYYVFSCYYKPTATRYVFSPGLGNFAFGNADRTAAFNLKTLTVSGISSYITNYGIINAGNGWYRCFVTMQATATGFATIAPFTLLGINDVINGYSGDGSSGIYVWGAQLEIGDSGPNSVPSIYVPTTTTTVPNVPYRQRLSANGNHYILQNYDEVTYNPNSGVITNLLSYSSQLNISPWNLATCTLIPTMATTDPNNGNTAWKLIENVSTSVGHNLQQSGISKSQGQILTLSVYAKAAERTGLGLVINDGVSGFGNRYGAEFDLLAGTAYNHDGTQGTFSSGSFSIKSVGNGWYRCSITVTTSIENASQIRIFSFPNPYNNWTSAAGYVGDGLSGLYLWGPQLQVGTAVTEYVTTGLNGVPLLQ